MARAGRTAALMAAMVLPVSCQTTSGPAVSNLGSSSRATSNVLSAGDVIAIAFPAAAELNQGQKIRLDGKVSLPMVGEVTAAGKSPLVLQEELSAKYKPHLTDATVIVTLTSSTSVVYVNGAVGGGGKIMLDRPMTVHEVIMESGGFAPTADRKKVILTREVGGSLQSSVLNLKDNGPGALIKVQPFDTITVNQSWF